MPDPTITYDYRGLLADLPGEWTPAAELRARHFLSAERLADLVPRVLQVRTQIDAERRMREAPAELRPLDAGFIDLPQQLLDGQRRQAARSELGRNQSLAARLRDEADRVIILGIGGSYLGARALFEALCSSAHNELPAER